MLRKAALLGALYFTQGLPFGLFIATLPTILRDLDWSLSIIGLFYLLELPWALKFVFAPLVDRFTRGPLGARRSWILPLQFMLATILGAMGLMDLEADLGWIAVGVIAASLTAAWHDVATDALAVDTLRVDERGLGNAVQVGGYRIGMMTGGGLLVLVYAQFDWTYTMLACAGLVLVASIPIVMHNEPIDLRLVRPTLAETYRLSGILAIGLPWLVTVFLYKFGFWLAGGMIQPMLVDQGIPIQEIGVVVGIVSFSFALLGAACGGLLVRSRGWAFTMMLGAGIQALTLLGLLVIAGGLAHTPFSRGLLLSAEYFAGGVATTAMFAAMMFRVRRKHSATDYAIQASVVGAAAIFGPALGGGFADEYGYSFVFLAAAALCVLSLGTIVATKGSVGHTKHEDPDFQDTAAK